MDSPDTPPAHTEADWIDMGPGVRRRTLVSGGGLMQMVVTFAAGSRLPEHQHPHEQVSNVVSGRMRFLLNGGSEARELGAGESIYLAPNLPHGAETLEDAVVTDTFTPPREDLLEQDRAHTVKTARV